MTHDANPKDDAAERQDRPRETISDFTHEQRRTMRAALERGMAAGLIEVRG